jgi:DNA-binding NarL/FixJ family response regulator
MTAAGYQFHPHIQEVHDFGLTQAREHLSPRSFAAAWKRGQMLELEEAIKFGLEPGVETGDGKQDDESTPGGLTLREVDVLLLLATGMTDAQIAEKLVISPRTVNAHLNSIYRKLDVNSRAAATRFAMENGLA